MEGRGFMKYLAIRALLTGFAGVSWSALAVAQEAATPPAAEQADSDGAGIGDIIVTAERRAQNVQRVPIAISTLSQGQLDAQGASTLAGLSSSVPSMQFSTQAADAPRVQITIRGLGSDVIEVGADTGVGLYLDNVYLGSTSAALSNVYDVNRVEILRGPQGTLYGRNTTGGAVNVISNQPTFSNEGAADIAVGNYSAVTGRAWVNGALSDNVAARITVVGERRDGFQKNLVANGTDGDDRRSFFARGQLLFKPAENFSFLLSGFMNQIDGAGPATRIIGAAPQIVLAGILPDGTPNLTGIVTPSPYAGAQPLPSDWHQVRKDARGRIDILLRGVTGAATLDLGGVTLKSTTSYQTNRQFQFADADSTELNLQTRQRNESGKQFTQEITLSGSSDKLDWLVGGFYLHDKTNARFELNVSPGLVGYAGPGAGANQTVTGEVTTRSLATFGQVSFKPVEAIELIGGLRYTNDHKTISTTAGFVDSGTNTLLLAGGLHGRVGLVAADTFEAVTGKVGINWYATDRIMVYASASRGFKSGGFNLGNPLSQPFGPEKVNAYELGFKSRFLDNAVQFNLSAFHYDVKGLQLQLFGVGGPEIFNAADAKINGVEADIIVKPTRALELTANLAYLDATFNSGFFAVDPTRPSFLPPNTPPVVNLSGNTLPRSPKFSAGLGATYTAELGSGNLAFNLNYSYRSKTFFNAFNPTDNFRYQPGYGLLGGSITYTAKDDRWSLSVFGQNITNKTYIANVFIPPIILGAPSEASIGAPATWGARLGVKF